AFVTTALFSSNLEVTFGIDVLALLMVAYSIVVTQKTLFGGRLRLSLEWQAKKALNFVDEFENSGRGWFWETDSLGTLSYVSRQLADDFQCEPGELLGRQFTDLLSVDHAPESTEEGKTLGFHLSARFPFSDVVVRPASDQDVHWSLSGNTIFDGRGRFLGFCGVRRVLGFRRHRRGCARAGPVRAGDPASRPLRFAARPAEPCDDAADLGG